MCADRGRRRRVVFADAASVDGSSWDGSPVSHPLHQAACGASVNGRGERRR